MGDFGFDEQWTCLRLCGNRVRRTSQMPTGRSSNWNKYLMMMIDDDTTQQGISESENAFFTGHEIKSNRRSSPISRRRRIFMVSLKWSRRNWIRNWFAQRVEQKFENALYILFIIYYLVSGDSLLIYWIQEVKYNELWNGDLTKRDANSSFLIN